MKSPSRRMVLRTLNAALITFGFPAIATAGDGCCAHCGCGANRCRKVFRLEKADRKITTTCWGMECEDFCVPGPSTPEYKQCETVCQNGPDDGNICHKPKKLVWISWIPGCDAEIFTKRKLMKKTVTTTVPSFKWVVEDACPQCVAKLQPLVIPPGTQIPAPPIVDGAVIVASHSD